MRGTINSVTHACLADFLFLLACIEWSEVDFEGGWLEDLLKDHSPSSALLGLFLI